MTEADRARQDSRKTMMLEAPLPSVIARMAVPSIVSFLITSIYNLAATYFVSSLGTEATAAVSVNASLRKMGGAVTLRAAAGSSVLTVVERFARARPMTVNPFVHLEVIAILYFLSLLYD